MDMRKCKECGKMFQPKGREQYCPDIHYRPCSECGEPVIAKYLSDPPRRCEKCKGKRSASAPTLKPINLVSKASNGFKLSPMNIPTPKTEPKIKPDTKAKPASKVKIKMDDLCKAEKPVDRTMFCNEMSGVKCRFVRETPLCGWLPGHDYIVNVNHDNAAYVVSSNTDTTDEDSITATHGIALRCASQITFYNYFRKVKE